jgi:hypothetical protein
LSDLRAELTAIRAESGRLTPASVVEAATAEDHPLHDRFEWDDALAGPKYRLSQARELIRVVKESYVDGKGRPESVRFFHAIPDAQGMAYQPLDEVTHDDLTSKVLLQSMEREWRSLRKRYERFSEFRDLVLGDLKPEAADAA